ncbi:hypothetical protein Nepgr_020581 [Nepenthes gracilis]|uniref:C2H2-type domain-containing protein n=1 Tax=Nepenthes gracilis TaxID=150966 RepID=A0AAD3SVK3_NEPGR|nr:hypothetical protein Nepgr_020581 [Nepenthes gracilis]
MANSPSASTETAANSDLIHPSFPPRRGSIHRPQPKPARRGGCVARPLVCPRCKGKFRNIYALSGHQNVHRPYSRRFWYASPLQARQPLRSRGAASPRGGAVPLAHPLPYRPGTSAPVLYPVASKNGPPSLQLGVAPPFNVVAVACRGAGESGLLTCRMNCSLEKGDIPENWLTLGMGSGPRGSNPADQSSPETSIADAGIRVAQKGGDYRMSLDLSL